MSLNRATDKSTYDATSHYGNPMNDPTDRSSLKPCPFCGGKATAFQASGEADYAAMVGCGECDVGTTCFETREEAIEAWNRRPAPSHDQEGLNRYEATLADTRTWHERTVVYEATTLADATTMAQQQCAKGRWADGSPSEQVTHMRCLPAITAAAEAFRYGMRNPDAVIAAVADALGRRHMEFAAIGERSTERYWRELALAAVLAAGSAALARGDGAAS